ncbi:hypothetical protein IQ269_00685 [Tychonema sp. LEGE 07199]|uniref:hypothetical protein n=1 Tax=unclassified Tychonema TaxID=2642144 RepID=UPI001880B6B4|nr:MULTISPECIES: hypothetical protein [unclassified Tychonema]MBE9119357.1 hypothetical protein [Tychonema sp. LEGE 07199]MBE9130556.1 hypothetical protein [Tychonema sp. LEGE 07196]
MEPHHQRKNDLEENIKEEYKLLKQLEEGLRLASEPQQKTKFNKDIEEVKSRVGNYNVELNSLGQSQQDKNSLVRAMTNITFKELDIVTQGIICMSIPSDTNFSVTPPLEKMFNNQLTGAAQSRLMTGVIQAKMVSNFVDNMVNVIPDFPERLKVGFVTEYQRLQGIGLEGNALFNALHEFSCHHSSDYDLKAAGLAVLYYLFEKCEVFER